jgi:hypothetical protein
LASRGECLKIAQTFPTEARRTILLQMAQVWQRLAAEQKHHPDLAEMPAPSSGAEQIQPVFQ